VVARILNKYILQVNEHAQEAFKSNVNSDNPYYEKSLAEFHVQDYALRIMPTPGQADNDNHDCGVYMCTNAEHVARGSSYRAIPKHAETLRKIFLLAIIHEHDKHEHDKLRVSK
jgi:Ulp1 family protease